MMDTSKKGELQDQNVEFASTAYGKNNVKVLHIRRQGKLHFIKELEVNVQLTLLSKKDYLYGDNSDIVATDTMKNTVYALAKQKGINTIEEFGMDISEHFLSSYHHVTKAKIYIEEAPWRRFEKNGIGHIHAFIYSPDGIHFCEVEQSQGEPPVLHAGIKEMRLLKTTQSGFEGFIKDRFTTLPEMKDRVFSTVVNCTWKYNRSRGIDFEGSWKTVFEIIKDKFAGSYDSGEYSPSVQKTLYDIQVMTLSKLPETEEVEIILPNKHYFTVDLSKMGLRNDDEVLLPLDKPAGNITATLRRKTPSKL
ncbi:uricase-like isoform X1 [Pleurodeles waltl]|uniref:uricase-like isoform X1 n=1 Tax=Pleurodeles waltl TaxID=8319 RepID=UPI003709C19C